ncbi:protein of unknown function (plasmid) [Cupriavidus taiwanensis]|uniref:Uncharacterized protein n=1 Tax=Cupriavidus taiwanensis TaxID=164546 RepID=A0A375ISJ3_9BURK|nr:protein of unknown function [Cupriavidus taiwanensis]
MTRAAGRRACTYASHSPVTVSHVAFQRRIGVIGMQFALSTHHGTLCVRAWRPANIAGYPRR